MPEVGAGPLRCGVGSMEGNGLVGSAGVERSAVGVGTGTLAQPLMTSTAARTTADSGRKTMRRSELYSPGWRTG